MSRNGSFSACLLPIRFSPPFKHMEKLNEYLKSLLSSCSDELRLEPDRNPYLVSANTTTDLANVPLVGPQISTMVFPLIPPAVKSALPNSNEIEFVHPHNLGNFNFTVQKSPAGFIVTIRPMLSDSDGSVPIPQPRPEMPPASPVDLNSTFVTMSQQATMESIPIPQPETAPIMPPPSYDLESAYKTNLVATDHVSQPSFDLEPAAAEFVPTATTAYDEAEVEVVDVDNSDFKTAFSDAQPYEPSARDAFDLGDVAPPAEVPGFLQEDYTQPAPTFELPLDLLDKSAHAFEPNPLVVQPTPAPAVDPAPKTAPVQVAPTFAVAQADSTEKAKMDALFNKMAELGASDLHLSVSMPPMLRKDGKMRPMDEGAAPMTPEAMRSLLTSIMPARNQEEFARRSDSDFAYEIPGLARFRCNIFMDRKGMAAVFRIIPSKMTTASQIGLSKAVLDLCGLSKGLVVVTGPTGSGKSTTLCAMVNEINLTREEHIITIEDPIEFVHENHKCLVNQREVHNHTDSFKDALRAALREDPDIVLVGEMRDLETISIAIETAETGHLVFGTLHTTTAASTVDRIIDQFPADRQQQIRVMLSESLKGVIAQTLLPKKGGGRVAALEILIVTPAISNLIREGKTFQIPSAMQTGKNNGMVMLNDALYAHVESGDVEPLDAYIKAVDKTGFESLLTRGGFKI